MQKIIQEPVYYKIFDKTYRDSSHIYVQKKDLSISFSEVKKNRESIINYFGADDILILNQVHSSKIIDADNVDKDLEFKGDGSVTTKKNLILAIQTADCVPVLLTSRDGRVIGAAHCGWRGAKLDIIKKLTFAMRNKGASDLVAIIGPAISQDTYEIDEKYYQNFTDGEQKNNTQFFIPSKNPKRYMFDLVGYVINKLTEEYVEIIKNLSENTYDNSLKYPSYRRAYHLGKQSKCHILSTIVIKPN